ncbi:MAG: hypothetical protein CMK92_05065 [Pseudomonas sp.]|nr:hypothetical protein [Pseudomonas sp.]
MRVFTGARDVDGSDFKVQTHLENPEDAAELLGELDEMCKAIISHMAKKYTGGIYTEEPELNPKKAYDRAMRESPDFVQIPDRNARARIITRNLLHRYDSGNLVENDPQGTKNTSFVLKKGEIMAICLRERQTGNKHLHELPILQFVTMHELAHIGTLDHGHNPSFWKNFKLILQEAAEIGYLLPDFKIMKPQTYCGIKVTQNPYYSSIDLQIIAPSDV